MDVAKAQTWARAWRFDALFMVMTKLSVIGALVTYMDYRGHAHARAVEYYNVAFIELYTVMVATRAKAGPVGVGWSVALAVLQGASLLLTLVPLWLLWPEACWSIDACLADAGRRLAGSAVLLGAAVVAVLYLISFAAAIPLILMPPLRP